MNFTEWRNSENVFEVQNYNYLEQGWLNVFDKFKLYNGMLPSDIDLSKTGAYISPIHYKYRIPGKMANASPVLSFVHDVDSGLNTPAVPEYGNSFFGMAYSNTRAITKYSEILEYIPRLYVVLTPLSEYYNVLSAGGYVQHFVDNIIQAPYAAAKTYGYKPQEVSSDVLSGASDMYVLTYYALYTSTVGNVQTLIKSYELNMSSSEDIYDTWLPGTITGRFNGKCFYPYMHSYIPKQYRLASSYARYLDHGAMFIGKGGGNGDFDGLNFSGINTLFSLTASGTLSENPYMTTNISRYPDNWGALKSGADTATMRTYVVADITTWKKILTASGMPWSFDLDIVKSPDGDGLNLPTEPGQPENPVDDTPGTGDNISDDIEYPQVSYFPIAARKLYAIDENTVNGLSNYLFSETFLNDVRRLWVSPGDYVVDISYYPFDFSEATNLFFEPAIGGSPIYVGNLNSGLTGLKITGGNPSIFGGSINVENYYNSYLDYAPHTSISVYIPYIGIRPLDIDLITTHSINLMYYLDLMTGEFIAALGADGDVISGNIGRPIAQFSGSMAVHVPISGTSNNELMLNSIVKSSQIVTAAGRIAGGAAAMDIGGTVSGLGNLANALGGNTVKHDTYGTLTAATGLFCPQTAYLIIDRPITAEPKNYKAQVGYSSSFSGAVSSFSGFLQCATVDIPSSGTISAEEQAEIESLLMGGIYIG